MMQLKLFRMRSVGVGQGCIELTVNWATLRMEGSGTGRAMNMMHGAFSIGAFAGPFVIGILIGANLSWTLVYRGMAILFVGVLALVVFLPFGALGRDAGHHATDSRRALYTHPAYWLGFFALFFYVGVEMGVSNWIAEYFVASFGASLATGSFMVSLFWGGLLLGRFGVPLLYHGEQRGGVLLSMAVLMSISTIALSALGFLGSAGPTRSVAMLFSALAGLGCSIVYPMVVTIVGTIFTHTQGEAIAFASTGGGVGAFVFPFVMSNIATEWGIQTGFATYAVFSLAVVFLGYRLVAISGGKKR